MASWAYDVLGISPIASDQEIKAAYVRLALQLHPDQHPEASPEERSIWEHEMSLVNDAHDALRDPAVRAAHRMQASRPSAPTVAPPRPTWEPPPPRPPDETECSRCGWYEAAEVQFREQSAWILSSRVDTYWSSSLCHDCGLGIGRSYQNRTLLRGWWGVRAFARNVSIVWDNSRSLSRVARLEKFGRDPAVETMVRRPMDTGPSVFKRAGLWAVVAIVAVVAIGAWTLATSLGGTAAPAPPRATWAVGSCVAGGDAVTPVDCAQPHVGKIVELTRAAADCPTTAPINVVAPEGVYCIDKTQ